jgi:hypothetical protein
MVMPNKEFLSCDQIIRIYESVKESVTGLRAIATLPLPLNIHYEASK